jgi:hypothetical protein
LTAETSMSRVTLSPTSTPPASSGAFHAADRVPQLVAAMEDA